MNIICTGRLKNGSRQRPVFYVDKRKRKIKKTCACIRPMKTHHSRTENQLFNYHTYIEHSIFQSHYILQRLYSKRENI